MLYFANPCGPDVITAMEAGTLGYIDTPAQGNKRPAGVKFCLDNGAFSDNFDELKWWKFLTDNAHAAKDCLFAVAPDVVGDAQATLDRSTPWLGKIRALGYPAAFVAQDGQEHIDVPWDDFDCLFIGGTTEWKLGPHARALAAEAKARGKWVHMGRVNSERRFEYARAIGCDSADGTYLVFGPDVNLPKLLAWTRNNDQPDLFGGGRMSHLVPLPWVKPPITLNPGLRSSSTHVKAAKVRIAKGEALEAIRKARTPKGIPGIELTLHYRVPDRRRRDADNLAATLKVCQDALVVAGVIHEDSWITVPSATCRIHPPSDQGPALWLEITEIP